MRIVQEVEFLIFPIDTKKQTMNIECLKLFDLKQESKHIIYLDTNNLYGYAMSKFLQQIDSNG